MSALNRCSGYGAVVQALPWALWTVLLGLRGLHRVTDRLARILLVVALLAIVCVGGGLLAMARVRPTARSCSDGQ